MKKFLIAGSSLAAVAAAGSAGAVDVTLGGSIDMGVEFGIGKKVDGLALTDGYSKVTLSIAAAGTTDAGIKYGGSFSLATAGELEFNPYKDGSKKKLFKYTVKNYSDLKAAVYNVSGGQKLDADNIVGVKINSEWKNASDGTATKYGHTFMMSGVAGKAAFTSSAICKIAGKVKGEYEFDAGVISGNINASGAINPNAPVSGNAVDAGDGWLVQRPDVEGDDVADFTDLPLNEDEGYLPAGKLANVNAIAADATANFALTLATSGKQSNKIVIQAEEQDADSDLDKGDDLIADKFNLLLANRASGGNITTFSAKSSEKVEDAAVYLGGPIMEVKLTSSTTKMVVGAVCLSGHDASETNVFMDVSSKVVTASGAKIFVEGGFGKLTLQTGDYAGVVSAIGDAGDAANLDSNGIVAIVEGSAMGASVVGAITNKTSLDSLAGAWLVGATVDMGGLNVALDYTTSSKTYRLGNDANSDKDLEDKGEFFDFTSYTAAWDLGLAFSSGDMSVAMAMDSSGDWGAKADASIAGIAAGVTLSNKSKTPHKKADLTYAVTAGMAMNGMDLGLSYDQDGDMGVSAEYAMGNLSIYGGYDTGDQGGKVGAKLSF